ncbi:MAG: serine hydrolase [Chitinophagaceae bacterium]|nr:serine hydrolase [Chitinophagaceae bacterium]
MFPAAAQNKTPDQLIENLLRKNKPLFDSVLANRNDWRVQILYSEILRDKKGKVSFADHAFNLDEEMYYYPASTVKLPVAILALQKLNELRIKGLDKNTTMITETAGSRQTAVYNDPSSADGRPTIAHYIKKILLVSDNDAFNRLYEFLGQEYINNTLQQMGYRHAQIIHRLEVVLTEEENRRTNPVRFVDSTGKLVYDKPAETSGLLYAARNTRIGKGFYRGGQLVNEPFDFSKKNRLTLVELHNIVKSILFPEAVPKQMRFNLTADDYTFLRKYMSMWPGESASPVYSAPDYWDTYVKFLYYGAENNKPDTALRIFNKVGDAYGFLIDGAYIADYANKTDFLLSAVIYCNSDGILNDNNYDYDTIGLPFMKNLGRMIHAYERTKVRKQPLTFFPQLPLYTR